MNSKKTFNLEELIHPTDRQRQFLEVIGNHRFVLYGGAMGGGKSYILPWWLVKYLLELGQAGIRNAQVGLFGEDYPSLNDRQISKIHYEFPRELGELRQAATRDFLLHPRLRGGRIVRRKLDDASKYYSAEFAAMAIDELMKNKPEVLDFLRTRLRWPGVSRPTFAAATNPGGIGHGGVKALWIDRKFPLEPLAEEFAFLPARAQDNPHLAESYYQQLTTLLGELAVSTCSSAGQNSLLSTQPSWRIMNGCGSSPAPVRCRLSQSRGQAAEEPHTSRLKGFGQFPMASDPFLIEALAGLPSGTHLSCLYATEDEHQALVTAYMRLGLERHEKVLYVADTHGIDTILHYLRAGCVDVDSLLASNQLAILSARESYLLHGVFDPDKMINLLRKVAEGAAGEGYSGLRVAGEMTWALQDLPGSGRLIEYEAKVNTLFPGSKCVGLCLYDQRLFPPRVLLNVLHTHPVVAIGTAIHDNLYYVPPEEFLGPDAHGALLHNSMKRLAERRGLALELREAREQLKLAIEEKILERRRAKESAPRQDARQDEQS